MLIIDQSHEILAMHIDPALIELAGRTCYRSGDKIGCALTPEEFHPEICAAHDCWNDETGGVCHCSSKCPHHSSNNFVAMLMRRGHDSVLEHSLLTVRFITNRGVTHEIVRHRLASFSMESTRYVNYEKKGVVFIRPEWGSHLLLNDWDGWAPGQVIPNMNIQSYVWLSSMHDCGRNYLRLLELGLRPEQARGVLPNDLKTEIVVSANAREWRHIFKLRTAKAAHPDMRALMIPLLWELQGGEAAVLFNDIEVKE